MKVAIGNDRKGLVYKNKIKEWLINMKYDVVDFGTNENIPCDYPIFAEKVALSVASGECEFGVLICSSGIGMSIAANKINGIRCGIGYDDSVVKLMREHNNANIITFGQDFMNLKDIENRINIFFNTSFIGDYHEERINLIRKIEKDQLGGKS